MNSLDTNSAVQWIVLVTFAYGENFGTVTRYTSHCDGLTVGGQDFLPEPSIEVIMSPQSGGVNDNPVTLRMLVRAPLDTLTGQRAHSPVKVTLEEMDVADAATRRVVFAGVIRKSNRNRDGKTGLVEVEIAGWRYGLEVLVNSWLADTSCNNAFGDQVCGLDLATVRETATVVDIAGNQIEVSGLTNPRANYWQFGYLAFEGLQIKVRRQISGTVLELLKPPPASWTGATVTAVPGCDKRLPTCRLWDREERFTGFGLKIPAYNPLLEAL